MGASQSSISPATNTPGKRRSMKRPSSSASATPPATRCVRPRATPALLEAAGAAGLLRGDTTAALREAHAVLADAGLHCTLDRRPRLMPETAGIAAARATVSGAVQAAGIDFGTGAPRGVAD